MSRLTALLAADLPRSSIETLDDALVCLESAAEHGSHGSRGNTTGSRAVYAGLASDRVGYAVLGGYDAAVRRLLAPREIRRASFCVTEEKEGVPSTHPRTIETRLQRSAQSTATVTGTKTFATLAAHAERWVVIASEGHDADGRNLLRAVVIERGARGVTLVARPPLPFTPEIPHARLELVDAQVAEILEGDGYERYVKPFRTVEDAHVTLAIAAYAYGEALRQPSAEATRWNASALLGPMESLLAIADYDDPTNLATHVALDDALRVTTQALDSLPWDRAPAPVAERWARDRKILEVAAKARGRRAEKARQLER